MGYMNPHPPKPGVDSSSKPITKIRRQIGQSTLTRPLCKATTRILRLVSEQPCKSVTPGVSDWPHQMLRFVGRKWDSHLPDRDSSIQDWSHQLKRWKEEEQTTPAPSMGLFLIHMKHPAPVNPARLKQLCKPPSPCWSPFPGRSGNWGLLLSNGHLPTHPLIHHLTLPEGEKLNESQSHGHWS